MTPLSSDPIHPCSFCGEIHEPGPVGEEGSWLAGVEIKSCDRIPPDHFYEHREFDQGPPGRLHKLDLDKG